MGCDYYHESLLEGSDDVDPEELSDEPGEVEFIFSVQDKETGETVNRESKVVEMPVGSKLYVSRAVDRPPIWSR